jgi:hypothetical protein
MSKCLDQEVDTVLALEAFDRSDSNDTIDVGFGSIARRKSVHVDAERRYMYRPIHKS